MTLRFTISRALGLAVALSLGSAVSAAAQQPPTTARERRDERMRVRKDQRDTTATTPTTPTTPTTGTPAGTPAGTTPTGATTTESSGMTSSTSATSGEMGRVRDTVVVQCNCGSTTTAASGGEVIPLIRPRGPKLFGNGLYLGLSGASTLPVGGLYKAYSEGWGANGYVGWDHKASPVGLRLSVGYNEFNGRMPGPVIRRGLGRMDVINDFGGAGVDARAYNAAINGKFRVPFGSFKGATSGVYAVAGGSVNHFRDYNQSLFLTNQFYGRGITNNDAGILNASRSESDNITRFGWNAGAGASLGFGNTEIFVESAYNRVYTPGRAINYLPLVVGLQIH
jgi:hypothetical protein